MSTILIFPLPELGHILPTLSLTRNLTQQGHRVVYLTAPQFTNVIFSVGGHIEPIIDAGKDVADLSGESIWYRFIRNYGADTHGVRFRELLASIFSKETVSLVLCDHILGKLYRNSLTSKISKYRFVLFSTSLFNWKQYEPDKSDIPTIVFCPEVFEVTKFRTPQKGLFYVESSLRPIDMDPDLRDFHLNDSPLVLASFGTQSVRYRGLGEWLPLIRQLATAQPRLQFVVAAGNCEPSFYAEFSSGLSNLIVRKIIPQRALLRQASALITHGGLGSIKEAICDGVPLVVLPMLYDQPFNAMRVRYHGLGEAIFQEKRSLRSLETAVCSAIDGAFARQVAQMRSNFLAIEEAQLSYLYINNRLANIENASTLNS